MVRKFTNLSLQIWVKQDSDQSVIVATSTPMSGTVICGADREVIHLERGVHRISTRCRFVTEDWVFEPTPRVNMTMNEDIFQIVPDVDIPAAAEKLGVNQEAEMVLKETEEISEPRPRSFEDLAATMDRAEKARGRSRLSEILEQLLWTSGTIVVVVVLIMVIAWTRRCKKQQRRRSLRNGDDGNDGNHGQDIPLASRSGSRRNLVCPQAQ